MAKDTVQAAVRHRSPEKRASAVTPALGHGAVAPVSTSPLMPVAGVAAGAGPPNAAALALTLHTAPVEGDCGLSLSPLRRFMTLPGDTHDDVNRKMLLLLLTFTATIASGAAAANGNVLQGVTAPTPCFCGIAFSAIFAMLFLILLCRRQAGGLFAAVCLLLAVAAVSVWDVLMIPLTVRTWPVFVLVLDAVVLLRTPRPLAVAIVCYIFFHLLLCEIELDTRKIGILDIPGGYTVEQRTAVAACDSPPCARNRPLLVPVYTACGYAVFALNYVLVRWLKKRTVVDECAVDATVVTSLRIARSLARFDLDQAEDCLHADSASVPAPLQDAFRQLITNLASYKPYLPQSCVTHRTYEDDDAASGPAQSEALYSDVFTVRDEPTWSETDTVQTIQTTESPGLGPRLVSGRCLTTNYLCPQQQVALLNVVVDLPTPSERPDEYTTRHCALLERVLAATFAWRGVVDTCHGNVIAASFNAHCPTVLPAGKALSALKTLLPDGPEADVSGVAVAGMAAVGVLGTSAMRQPCILGSAPTASAQLLQYLACARRSGPKWLCNAKQYAETRLEQPMKIVMDVVYFDDPLAMPDFVEGPMEQSRRVMMPPMLIYEIILEPPEKNRRLSFARVESAEWMYELDTDACKEWETYNTLGRKFLLESETAMERCVRRHSVHAVEEVRIRAAIANSHIYNFVPRISPVADSQA